MSYLYFQCTKCGGIRQSEAPPAIAGCENGEEHKWHEGRALDLQVSPNEDGDDDDEMLDDYPDEEQREEVKGREIGWNTDQESIEPRSEYFVRDGTDVLILTEDVYVDLSAAGDEAEYIDGDPLPTAVYHWDGQRTLAFRRSSDDNDDDFDE